MQFNDDKDGILILITHANVCVCVSTKKNKILLIFSSNVQFFT